MTPFQTRAEEAAEALQRAYEVEDWDRWYAKHGPTAVAALRAVAGGQEAWQLETDGEVVRSEYPRERDDHLEFRRVLIIETPDE